MANGWEIAKDGCGFLGSALAAWPWFRDFLARVAAAQLKRAPPGDARARRFLRTIHERAQNRAAEPRFFDLFCQSAGLCLLALSFLISLLRNLG